MFEGANPWWFLRYARHPLFSLSKTDKFEMYIANLLAMYYLI